MNWTWWLINRTKSNDEENKNEVIFLEKTKKTYLTLIRKVQIFFERSFSYNAIFHVKTEIFWIDQVKNGEKKNKQQIITTVIWRMQKTQVILWQFIYKIVIIRWKWCSLSSVISTESFVYRCKFLWVLV